MLTLNILLLPWLMLLSGVSGLGNYDYVNRATYHENLTDLSVNTTKVLYVLDDRMSLFSCMRSCTADKDCTEFGFRDKNGGDNCLLIREGDNTEKLPASLIGYTYYTLASDTLTYCDRPASGRAWMVFQRRFDGSEDFLRGWSDYKLGFGEMSGEFWLGNDELHELTKNGDKELRIELVDGSGVMFAAEYDTFMVGDETSQYKLTIGGFKGCDPPGDALTVHHNNAFFSTIDRDNDGTNSWDCAAGRGGWWYSNCHTSNLNGVYGSTAVETGLNWYPWHAYTYSMSATRMMIRNK